MMAGADAEKNAAAEPAAEGMPAGEITGEALGAAGTESVCPVCLGRISARRILREDGAVILEKTCPEHGTHRDILWKGRLDYREWRGPEAGEKRMAHGSSGAGSEADDGTAAVAADTPDCTHCRNLCGAHERGTCCTLLEITDRCNLHCRFCFADPEGSRDPSLAQVKSWIFDLTVPGETFLQLSGGEPTVRDDLPEIVSFARKCGCRYIQVNSNGIRLAQDEDYVRRLAEAGLSFVFLQFDGVTDDVYRFLRGRDLLETKKACIEACARHGIGVTLVPTVVPGVNDRQVGAIVAFGAERSPAVRGVHFQPVSYFGRLPEIPTEESRYTLDCLLTDLEDQTGGGIPADRIQPSCCDHPMCGFHGDFVVLPDGSLYPLSGKRRKAAPRDLQTGSARKNGTEAGEAAVRKNGAEAGEAAARKNREFIGRHWERRDLTAGSGGGAKSLEAFDMSDMDTFLKRVKSHSFTITAMAFQDAGNIDAERLRRCSLHVYRRGRKMPFCAAYLSPWGKEHPAGRKEPS